MGTRLLTAMVASAALCGCAPLGPAAPDARSGDAVPAAIRYRCADGTELKVLFEDDTALVEAGGRGRELLLRDAGGITPQQTVYSNPRLRAEFGLDPDGTGAVLHDLAKSLDLRCRREPDR